jgi:tetratricopeptide (TPR) repeat protein
MIGRKILVGILAIGMSTTLAGVNSYALAPNTNLDEGMELKAIEYVASDCDFEDLDFDYSENYEYTFEEFKELLKSDLDLKTLDAVESLFNEAIVLEKENKYEDAEKLWSEIDEKDIFEMTELDFSVDMDSEFDLEAWSFEDFESMLKTDIDKETLKTVKTLFDEAIKLEFENKFDEAFDIWDNLFYMDIYENDVFEMTELDSNVDMDSEFDLEPWSFEEFESMLKTDIDKQTLETAKTLFDQAIKLELENKFDEAFDIWDTLFDMDIYGYDEIIEEIEVIK